VSRTLFSVESGFPMAPLVTFRVESVLILMDGRFYNGLKRLTMYILKSFTFTG